MFAFIRKLKLASRPSRAAELAFSMLLGEQVPLKDVIRASKAPHGMSGKVFEEELALLIALSFFDPNDRRYSLGFARLKAQLIVLEWIKEGKVTPCFAHAFESSFQQHHRIRFER